MYNITGYTNFQDFLGSANSYTGGWFWSMMLCAIAIVIFASVNQRTTTDRSLFTAGIGTWLFGTFLFFLGWINWMVYFLTILGMVAGLVAVIVGGDNEI